MSDHFTSSPFSSPARSTTTPINQQPARDFSFTSPSPTSTFSESSSPANNIVRLRNEASRSSLRSLIPSPSGRKIIIRSDPAMLTCFEKDDEQLYDLWAPREH
ncbi:hypothetical protein C8J56DRAFT_550949 [Mycena floridula]|nr:hypothetical protein C8J56DRAFT_550949 [Mycena floridula]